MWNIYSHNARCTLYQVTFQKELTIKTVHYTVYFSTAKSSYTLCQCHQGISWSLKWSGSCLRHYHVICQSLRTQCGQHYSNNSTADVFEPSLPTLFPQNIFLIKCLYYDCVLKMKPHDFHPPVFSKILRERWIETYHTHAI